MIDTKYKFIGFNPISGNVHTQDDAVMFLAKDRAFLLALPTYIEKLIVLGADERQIAGVRDMLVRVTEYQNNVASKVPDCTEQEAALVGWPIQLQIGCIDGSVLTYSGREKSSALFFLQKWDHEGSSLQMKMDGKVYNDTEVYRCLQA